MEHKFSDQYRAMTRAQILAREKEASPEDAERVRDEVRTFIQHHSPGTAKFLLTHRKDGRSLCRPVSAFTEGWTVGTISQLEHLKNQHIRRNPEVGYLWVEMNPTGDSWLKTVWMNGVCEIVDDRDQIKDFYERRRAVTGFGDAHSDDDWVRLLLRTTPTLVRAEGFLGRDTPALYRDFSH
ncbi:MAG: pyridoxamine 5'-phosphate oxidase family protein [Dehalococcoidia bacterium]